MIYYFTEGRGAAPTTTRREHDMKKHEISGLFTSHVTDAINEGFVPCMTELTGSYSDVMGTQMVFAKGDERIIMWMEEKDNFGLYNEDAPSNVTLRVARISLGYGETLENSYCWPRDWKRHVVHEQAVYRVSDRSWKGDWYSASEEEAREAMRKRRERFYLRGSDGLYRDYEMTDRLFAIVRRLKGFKTVKRQSVRVWKYNGVWHVENTKSGNEVTLAA